METEGRSPVGLERFSHIEEVPGSSPGVPTKATRMCGLHILVFLLPAHAVLFLVLRGGHVLVHLEDAVEVLAGGEAAVVGDGLAAPVGVL